MNQKLLSLDKNDFEFQTFRAGGKGGQHQNTTDSGVRCIHKATGISAESRNHRSQARNKKEAWTRVVNNENFRKWLKLESMKVAGLIKSPKQIEKEVDEMIERDLENGNIKIEILGKKGEI